MTSVTPGMWTTQDGAVLTVWFDNLPFNFLTTAMITALHDIVRRADTDDSIRAVVLTSAVENVFISHFDVAEILAASDAIDVALGPRLAGAALRLEGAVSRMPHGRNVLQRTPAAGVVALKRFHDVIAGMRSSDVVYLAAINGRALGGGCELALGCDIRLMADGPFQIGLIEVLMGLIPGGGGTQGLTRTVGMGRAVELCLEGRMMDPSEAKDIGLLHHVVPPAALMDEAHTIAARLARRPPTAVGAIKRAVYEGGSDTLARGLHIERTGFMAAASEPATRAAMRRYLDGIEDAEKEGGMEQFIAEHMPAWLDGTAHRFHPYTDSTPSAG